MRHEWDFPQDPPEGGGAARLVAELNCTFAGKAPQDVIEFAVTQFAPKLTCVSSFGAEAVILLHMISEIDRHIPVLFLDSLMHFPETLDYQTKVAASLGLTDVRGIEPDATLVRLSDADGKLHARAPDDCCYLRKVLPLDIALLGFDAWLSGRKRIQNGVRADLELFELDQAQRIKINPLAFWGRQTLADYMDAHALPKHPLVAKGYPSIGCAPCTRPVAVGGADRSGRWAGTEKTECGIHFPART